MLFSKIIWQRSIDQNVVSDIGGWPFHGSANILPLQKLIPLISFLSHSSGNLKKLSAFRYGAIASYISGKFSMKYPPDFSWCLTKTFTIRCKDDMLSVFITVDSRMFFK